MYEDGWRHIFTSTEKFKKAKCQNKSHCKCLVIQIAKLTRLYPQLISQLRKTFKLLEHRNGCFIKEHRTSFDAGCKQTKEEKLCVY